MVEQAFLRGRLANLDEIKTQHRVTTQRALTMMSSEQLKAFDITEASAEEQASFGDSPFGRGCLAAVRLVEVGVRCIEITLNGWDTHIPTTTSWVRAGDHARSSFRSADSGA